MKIITIKNINEVKWPNRCAYCNREATAFAKARKAEGTGYYVVAYTEKHTSIEFPVCKKHKLLAKFHNMFSWLGVGKTVIFLIFSPAIFAIIPMLLIKNIVDISDMKGPGGIGDIVLSVSYGFIWLASIYLYLSNPVKLKNIDEKELAIQFKNDDFAYQFETENR